MKERPIIFNGEMVRAVLAGRKTQTRRVMKDSAIDFVGGRGDDINDPSYWGYADENGDWYTLQNDNKRFEISSPYGQPGDRLWVRETFTQDERGGKESNGEDAVYYKADMPSPDIWQGFWKPSIHMPRWASRILLEVVNIRVERVQDISEDDAKAEGITPSDDHENGWYYTPNGDYAKPQIAFMRLWNSINEKRGYGWSANPWVWVVEFKVSEGKE